MVLTESQPPRDVARSQHVTRSSTEKVSPESSELRDIGDVGWSVRFCVGDQIGDQQTNRDVTAQAIRQML